MGLSPTEHASLRWTHSCPKMRTEPKSRILEALSKFAETSRRGTGSAIRDPEQTSPPDHPFRPTGAPERVHNLDGEQVCRSDSAPMSLEEGAPRHALAPLRSRRNTVLGEEPLDGVASEFMSEVLECAPQARISPRRVLSRHAHNEFTDILRRRRSAWAPVLAAIVLGCDEAAVPAQKRSGVWQRTQSGPAPRGLKPGP